MRLLRRTPCERTGLPRLWRRGAIAQGTVWTDCVVVLPPPFDEYLGLEQRVKRFPLEQFVSKHYKRISRWSDSWLLLLIDFLPEIGCRFGVDRIQSLNRTQKFGVPFWCEVELKITEGHVLQH